MIKRLFSLQIGLGLILILLSNIGIEGNAHGQQSAVPAPAQAPYSYEYGYGYNPYQTPPYYHLLTQEERELLQDGEISSGQVFGGGAIAMMFGFGVGHAVQGRFGSDGWKFALGESASIAGILIGIGMVTDRNGELQGPSPLGRTVILGSAIGFVVFRLWEIVDAFAGPAIHNKKYRAARWKAYGAPPPPQYGLFVAPTQGGGEGTVAGLRMSF